MCKIRANRVQITKNYPVVSTVFNNFLHLLKAAFSTQIFQELLGYFMPVKHMSTITTTAITV